ncbi:MAG: antitoxin, RHH family protein [Deltaproteobacteria bacterium]|nr:antitoxin, RHH family protein [Deltaproteobacteria bacterium]
MPTDLPRLNVVLEKPLHRALSKAAKKAGMSLSLKARNLIREALELEEDLYWESRASERSKTFDSKKALSHEEVWNR